MGVTGWTDYIAVDWGTTNRRAYRLGGDGRSTGEMEDGRGILSIGSGDFPAAVAEIRAALGDLPMVLAGMVGSNRGWVEVPYIPCPAGIAQLADGLVWAEPERSAIVPGLSFKAGDRADVMRGEEVQLFGAVMGGLIPPTATVCHPGTHNKWAAVEDSRITAFRTVMTGEMFSLLSERGLLAELLKTPVLPGKSFTAGVRAGLSGTALTAELFTVRARVLLGDKAREEAASFASGLLIGADVRTGLDEFGSGKEVMVMGRPELTRLYSAALREAGARAREIDGETAFLHGAREIVGAMR